MWIGTTAWRIIRSIGHSREIVKEIKAKNLEEALKKSRESLDTIDRKQYKRSLETPNNQSAKGVAKKLSSDNKCRGPEQSGDYPKHYNPNSGPFSDVHVEPSIKKYMSAIAVVALIPHANEASQTEGITTWEFTASSAWDVLNAIDPVGITDAME